MAILPLWAETDWADLLLRWSLGVLIFLSTTVVSYLIGRWWGTRTAWRKWKDKFFLDRINVSLNSVRDGHLIIRTIMERSLDEVFLNPVAVNLVHSAALRTTADNALLPVGKEDRWYLLSFVLNAVSEHFAAGVIRREAGLPVQCLTYLLFLTCEHEGEDRIRKVRALMVQEEMLVKFPFQNLGPLLEDERHRDRVMTLGKAAQTYQAEPDLFIRVEVCV
jgi:hypothetical protein